MHTQWTREKACQHNACWPVCVAKQAQASVSTHTSATLNVGAWPPATADAREVSVQDLPCFGGAKVAVTSHCAVPWHVWREPQRNASDVDGARRDKEAKYPELAASGRCTLVVVGVDTGGRWSEETADFLRQLSTSKANEVPSFMRRSVSLAWERRWTRMLSVVCATIFAASMVEPARQCESIWWTGGDCARS